MGDAKPGELPTNRSKVTGSASVTLDQAKVSVELLSVIVVPFSGEMSTGVGGGELSTTFMTWLAEAVFPDASVAVQVTVVVPSGNPVISDAPGESLVTLGDGSLLSNTNGLPRLTGVSWPVASTVIGGGVEIFGATVSGPLRLTVMGVVAHCWFPKKSVALLTTVVLPCVLMLRIWYQLAQLFPLVLVTV